ncbi:hypothetical protein E2C01_001270 [Portunus trituberculatus]|uniref:Uncharacterized protein n=1 Tax=Portunus trituberculatus TaxID=210409 RepID=A0A5B7CGR4_PORTR|nr:hypothetical protein [Portunus trituberculatus]
MQLRDCQDPPTPKHHHFVPVPSVSRVRQVMDDQRSEGEGGLGCRMVPFPPPLSTHTSDQAGKEGVADSGLSLTPLPSPLPLKTASHTAFTSSTTPWTC